MAFFGSKVRKLLQELRLMNENQSDDLGREIREFLEEIEEDYESNRGSAHEFHDFMARMKPGLDAADANRLEDFARRFAHIERAARHGVESLRVLARDQRKLSRETSRRFDQLRYES